MGVWSELWKRARQEATRRITDNAGERAKRSLGVVVDTLEERARAFAEREAELARASQRQQKMREKIAEEEAAAAADDG